MLKRKRTIRCGFEAVENVAELLNGSHAISVEEIEIELADIKTEEPTSTGSTLSKAKTIFISSLTQVTFVMRPKGTIGAYSATNMPEIDVPIQTSGFAATVDLTAGSEEVAYRPSSDQTTHRTATFEVYADGLLYVITGCKSTWETTIDSAQQEKMTFTVKGRCIGVIDSPMPVDIPVSIDAPRNVGLGFRTDGYDAVTSSLKINPSINIIYPDNFNEDDGFGSAIIMSRDATCSFNTQAVLVATHDFEAKYRNGEEFAITTGLIGNVQYNRKTYNFPKVYYSGLAAGDQDGIATNEVTFGILPVNGDDELELIFS